MSHAYKSDFSSSDRYTSALESRSATDVNLLSGDNYNTESMQQFVHPGKTNSDQRVMII